jgi:hypothetical protein
MNNKIYIGIIAVLLCVVGWLAWKVNTKEVLIVNQQGKIQSVTDERDILAVELEAMKMGYDTLKTDNEEMAGKILEQKSEIAALIKKAKNKDYDLAKLKKETETLRTIMKGYIHQIDSLQQANERLFAEKEAEANRANQAENRSKELEGDLNTAKDMVSKGSVLSTGDFANTGINLRSSGKQVETERASKSEMIKSCFTVRKNPIVKPGAKTIYLRILSPDGTLLPGKESATVNIDGKNESVSVGREIDYQNQDLDVCVFYTAQGELKKGNYKIQVFESGRMIGVSDLSLK